MEISRKGFLWLVFSWVGGVEERCFKNVWVALKIKTPLSLTSSLHPRN